MRSKILLCTAINGKYYEIFFHFGLSKYIYEISNIITGRQVVFRELDGTETEKFPELNGNDDYKNAIAWNGGRKV